MYQLTTDPTTVINLDNGSYYPVTDSDYQDWLAAGNTPLPVPLSAWQSIQITNMLLAYDAAKAAGIVSSALGTAYTYTIDDTDITLFNSMVTASMLSQMQGQTLFPLLAMDSNGIWAYRPHNISEVQEAASDVYAGLILIVNQYQDRLSQIVNGTTADAINAVVW
jgi:hypothetical protein